MIIKLLTGHHLEFLSLKGGCRGSSKSTLVKMPHCWLILCLFQVLHEAGCCAPLYAEFDNGVAMGYVHGEMLDLDSVRDKKIGK